MQSFNMKFSEVKILQGGGVGKGSNFLFSCWFLHLPYNSAGLLRCLWLGWCVQSRRIPPPEAPLVELGLTEVKGPHMAVKGLIC